MNKTNLKWRLSRLPTSEEVRELVKDKIITQEEAREILFTSETEEEIDKKESLKAEIKFLREVVDKLAEKSVQKTIITEHITQYQKQPFYQPYYQWAVPFVGGSWNTTLCGGNSTLVSAMTSSSQNNSALLGTAGLTDCSVTAIKTF